jgi:hypothetical protein
MFKSNQKDEQKILEIFPQIDLKNFIVIKNNIRVHPNN